ncbi:MAG: motility associated factor glycosyltransferase family protein [Phycisphaerales bacterium JB063]
MTAPTPSPTLTRNLSALSRQDPALAQQIANTTPATLEWSASKAGPLTATLVDAGKPVPLASRYDPAKEADKLIGDIDRQTTACVVVLGLGLGYHVDQLVRGGKHAGPITLTPRDLVILFEPDTALLRAVLERLDYSDWLGHPSVVLAGPDTDKAALLQRLESRSGTLTLGTQLVTHPGTRQRRPDEVNAFGKLVTETLAYCRTNVATALVNASRTVRNLACNLPHYAAGATVHELAGAASGKPAVCVGAGPSLVKNLDLLRDPELRRNVVVIGVQTTLKPMLDRGIRPDFITALDYSAICTRFYEGLPPLPDVTLVAEPKCHPAIIAAYPGPVRVCQSPINDKLLGNLARPIQPIRSGTTVAHLSFYLAQLLGCDPIIFIGQDLGFSDGLYYCPGTAVHNVWAGELGPFNTLETMEWTRIVRMRGNLRRAEDVHGRPIFTDEQMSTYLGQFERDFAQAKQQGTTVIDATEGGMPKAHTTTMTLRDALERYALDAIPELPKPQTTLDLERLRQTKALMADHLRDIRTLRHVTTETIDLLKRIRKDQRDPARVDKLFAKVTRNTRRVQTELDGAFRLVSAVNTIGTFRRERTDRQISHRTAEDPFAQQLVQIERDLDNLDFIQQSCDEAVEIFEEARQRLEDAVQSAKQATADKPAHAAA